MNKRIIGEFLKWKSVYLNFYCGWNYTRVTPMELKRGGSKK